MKKHLISKTDDVVEPVENQLKFFSIKDNEKIDSLTQELNSDLNKLAENPLNENCVKIYRPQVEIFSLKYKKEVNNYEESVRLKAKNLQNSLLTVISNIDKNIDKLEEFLEICFLKIKESNECTIEKVCIGLLYLLDI